MDPGWALLRLPFGMNLYQYYIVGGGGRRFRPEKADWFRFFKPSIFSRSFLFSSPASQGHERAETKTSNTAAQNWQCHLT